ncbi:MAG TPA: hypothetical protein VFY41_04700 [Nitrososphaeraceae archaeon]|jgi:hypothetical protein|nr:hypothetical protein [Nitrososphaeraceae archaeon]
MSLFVVVGGSSDSVASGLTIILLFIALSIFIWLAVRSRGITTFQFQIAIFILIWILGEIIGVLQEYQILLLSPFFIRLPDISLQIHLLAMVFLSVMLWIRFYHSERRQKKLIDDLSDKKSLS